MNKQRPSASMALVGLMLASPIAAAQQDGGVPAAEVDTDEDGIPDVVEIYFLMNPRSADTDLDGIDDATELSVPCICNPVNADTDNDGVCDGYISIAGRCEGRAEDEGICGALGGDRGQTRLSGSGGACNDVGASSFNALAFLALVALLIGGSRRRSSMGKGAR